ncbi:Hsp20/alpha crystallin family protein [Glycomyces sp. NPDC048151]|uniref:Hsp20/alpha crystallin family protein n=1 Tax=Glycomyces sp. NPDC048151 TaxID=3364002 RepID=UPI003711EDBA
MTHLPARRTAADPMGLMDDFSAYMNRMMGPYFAPMETGEGSWTPLSDVSENAEAYHVDIELPGVAREDITVDIEGQELTVTGEFHREDHGDGTGRRSSRREGRFEFGLRMPHTVDAANCSASLEDGVLCLTIPKAASEGHRKIEIK